MEGLFKQRAALSTEYLAAMLGNGKHNEVVAYPN
jgi:hypothetical protein